MIRLTRLNACCEAVMEAAWLTALACIPLFFTIWGESIQGEKSYLLRALTIVLLTAWIIKSISPTRPGTGNQNSIRCSFKRLIETPLVAPVFFIAVLLGVGTLLSLSPWTSFWGTALRRHGSYNAFCCLAFFAAIASTIRSDRQVDRIVTLAILTSIPICLYGIGQRFSIDPIILLGKDQLRVGSTIGNPIFLAAYLIMIVPLTLSRIIFRFLSFRSGNRNLNSDLILAIIYSLTALLQLGAITQTFSRGPSLGLFVGSVILFLSLGIYWRKQGLVWGTIGAGVLLLAGLALLNRPDGPLHTLAEQPGIQRFSQMLTPKSGSSGRLVIWEMAVETSRFSKAVQSGNGEKDRFSAVRFLFGYGPETVELVGRLYSLREYNAEMEGHLELDRFHSDFWDTLITAGILGLVAKEALLFLTAYFACRCLGSISTPRQRVIFIGLVLSGGLLGAFAFASRLGMPFLGLGLRFGTSMGLIFHLLGISWRRKFDAAADTVPTARALIMMALLSAVVGHSVEISFSFDIETTLFYFWISLALLLVIGHRLPLMERTAILAGNAHQNAISGTMNLAPGPQPGVRSKMRLCSAICG